MERVRGMVRIPLQKGAELLMDHKPASWRDRCAQLVRKVTALTGMVAPAVTTRDWSFKDCQDYTVRCDELKLTLGNLFLCYLIGIFS